MEKIEVCMVVVVVVGKAIPIRRRVIEHSRVVKQCIICDGIRIPAKSSKELFGALVAQWLMV